MFLLRSERGNSFTPKIRLCATSHLLFKVFWSAGSPLRNAFREPWIWLNRNRKFVIAVWTCFEKKDHKEIRICLYICGSLTQESLLPMASINRHHSVNLEAEGIGKKRLIIFADQFLFLKPDLVMRSFTEISLRKAGLIGTSIKYSSSHPHQIVSWLILLFFLSL